MLAGLTVASLLGAAGTSMIGYYTPFLFATSVLGPIASGLLTTIDLDGSIVKAAALLGFVGAAIGFGIQAPLVATQATLSSKDVSIGAAILLFGGGLGSAFWICISVTLFQNRITEEIKKYSPGTDPKTLETVGLSDIRSFIGSNNLRNVLIGYNEAVVQTLYLPLGLSLLTLAGTLSMEVKSIKKKQS
ncbi:hypothetical protein LTS08_008082 [Lithohypha guttulata]|nr:hypothetical protein LTS08_008082 [Lithohypha guttulata]